MQTKYVFNGRFTAGDRDHVEGPLVVFVDNSSLVIVGRERSLGRSALGIAPFCGSMLFGTVGHYQREEVIAKGYELTLQGTTLGVYDDGGGKEGDYDVFPIREARIRGNFGFAGLTVNIKAQTSPGYAVCYSSLERRENAYAAIEVSTEFVVPPEEIQAFMMLRFSTKDEMFARFKWRQGDPAL